MTSPPNLLSDDDIRLIGLEAASRILTERGYQVRFVDPTPANNPQIRALHEKQLAFVYVRTAAYPYAGEIASAAQVAQFIDQSRANGARCIFMSLSLANAHGESDLEKSLLAREGSFRIALHDLVELHSASDYRPTRLSYAFNKEGGIGGVATMLPDGRYSISPTPSSDFNAGLMSSAFVFSSAIGPDQRRAISAWAHLSEDDWTQAHREAFAAAFMHYLYLAKEQKRRMPESLAGAADLLDPAVLPPLRYPLTEELIRLISALFGGTEPTDSDAPR